MLILIGPSASGKTAVAKSLIKLYQMKKLVTYTTRRMRPGEVNGIDYHFISESDFKARRLQDFFIETIEYNGNFYGTSRSDISPDRVLIVEPKGLKHYLSEQRDKIKVCYLACSKEVRRQRMIARNDSIDTINYRLAFDDELFNHEIMELADWVIAGDSGSPDYVAHIVYDLYQKAGGLQ